MVLSGRKIIMTQPRNKDGRFAPKEGNGKPTITTNRQQEIEQEVTNAVTCYLAVQNAQFSRASFGRLSRTEDNFDPRRSINDECGFPSTREITIEKLKELYDREPIAARVVELEPDESWRVSPTVVESEDSEAGTDQESKFQDEEGSPIYKYLRLVDIRSRIGGFGVLLYGLDDGKPLDKPAEPKEGQKLLFLRAFDQSLVKISRFEDDSGSIRFGRPISYDIMLNHPSDLMGGSLGVPNQAGTKVHWTRVLHVAEEGEVFGTPSQLSVYNNLLNLRKEYHSDAEGYYKGAFPGLSLEVPSGVDLEQILPFLQSTISDVRDEIEQYQNSLQKVLGLIGLHANQLIPNISDPTAHILVQLQAICIKKGCPMRIFMGSERGHLASDQDEKAWSARMDRRRQFHITPEIIVPFVDRMIWLGILPEPEGYSVSWPELNPLTPLERAEVAEKLTEAMAKFVQGDAEAIITVADWYMRIVGLSQEEANEIVEARMEGLKEEGRLTGQEPEEDEGDENDESIKPGKDQPSTSAASGKAGGAREED
jgi:hypothetical protein